MRGLTGLALVVSACASGPAGGDSSTPTERPPARDPWAMSMAEDASRCPTKRRCPPGGDVPACESKPGPSEVSPIDERLLAKVDQRVTLVAKPTYGVICTLEGCDCCNECRGPVLLCGDERCEYSIEIGSCDGDQELTCCSMAVRHRPLVARGVLRKVEYPEDEPVDGAKFEIEQAHYCYLEDH